jgi:hypothetical protein
MSQFTYISFPRKVDNTMHENGTIALKSYKLGELIWNKENGNVVRNQSTRSGILVDCSKLMGAGFFHGLRVIEDMENAVFENCFKNRHIYALEGCCVSFNGDLALFNETSEFVVNMLESALINIELCRKQLRDLLKHNLQKGEFAEIYSESISDSDFNFGPPLSKMLLTVDEILFSQKFTLDDKLRIKIRR